MTKSAENNARRQNILNHIKLIEERYPEEARRESVELLKKRLFQIVKD